ncbi:Na(+)/H(+) antiporter subunit B [Virgibacillus sp. C22-A2]|uniref:Na(+)/H(+) antiporter subunit B n=1 Tax=Virgibacillus tibetensis TaxID=3042313 RepID=A0ABU6KBS0_9BACI|nr:Na(+)/H(+) antiporter subunit B [Virgibacillus sp. C22-A2]
MYKTNDIVLRTTTSLIAFILLGFAVYLLIAGHNSPGGGFVGGLMTSGAVLLMYMAYGIEAVKKMLPINFLTLIPIGLAIALGTGMASFLFGVPFLTQTFDYFTIPLFGEIELATAMIFDIGVYLTVVGVMITIILTIATDQ